MNLMEASPAREASVTAQKLGDGVATLARIALKLSLGEDFVVCAEPAASALILHATNCSRRVLLPSSHGHSTSFSLS
jgi:hypothetical protein